MAAATSLSAQTDVSHPQWTNNDISEDDIKAKIEAISREIAQVNDFSKDHSVFLSIFAQVSKFKHVNR